MSFVLIHFDVMLRHVEYADEVKLVLSGINTVSRMMRVASADATELRTTALFNVQSPSGKD